MSKRRLALIGGAVLIGGAIAVRLSMPGDGPGERDVAGPAPDSPLGIAMLQGGPTATLTPTPTPAPAGGVYPTPAGVAGEVIENYAGFGGYADGLEAAEEAIEGGQGHLIRRLGSGYVAPCDPAHIYPFQPTVPLITVLLRRLLRGGSPRVQGVYHDGEGSFGMVVTGLAENDVPWPTPQARDDEPRATIHHQFSSLALIVHLVVEDSVYFPPGHPYIVGLSSCEYGYYRGVEDMWWGPNIDGIYYARD